MRSLDVLRKVAGRETRRALGLNPFAPRMNQAQAQAATLDAEILALPVDTSQLADIRTSDQMGWVFMLGASALGGPDPLA
jgi:hypothetical protein